MKIKEFRQRLEEYFVSNNGEWIDVHQVDSNRIDIRIVSEKINDMAESEQFITNMLKELNEGIKHEKSKFVIGYTNYNTITEAEFLEITKPNRNDEQPSNFAELIEANSKSQRLNNEEVHKSRIISFYSYKGGVGRTVALIETAYLLAKEGKKVLLFDLDIEAPSFINIFEGQIKSEYGLVDYLYEQLYFDKPQISLTQIISKLNTNLEGEIYTIPAGILDNKYVNRLDKLKEKRIFNNNYVHNIIGEAENKFNIDYVLVDSRTGINKWGALSIIDIADEVILFAYPNKENIEGLRIITDLIKETKKTTVAFSRIDNSIRGKEIANRLFEKLELNQEYLSIYYDSEIALAETYPIKSEKVLNTFKPISNFILENDVNEKNKEFIVNNEVIIKDTLEELTNIGEVSAFSQNEFKIHEDSNWILVGKEEIYFKRCIEKLEQMSQVISIESSGQSYDVEKKEITVRDVTLTESITDEFIEIVKQINEKENEGDKITYTLRLWITYFEYILNETEHDIEENTKVNRIHELIGKSLREYFDYNIENVETDDNAWRDIIYLTQGHYFNKEKDYQQAFQMKTNIVLNWSNFKESTKEINSNLLLTALNILVDTIMEDLPNFQFKLFIDTDEYNKSKDIFGSYSSSTLELDWDKLEDEDIRSEILTLLGEVLHKPRFLDDKKLFKYFEFLSKTKFTRKVNGEDSKLKSDYLYKVFFNNDKNKIKLINLILGKRIHSSIYSKTVIQWLYEKLKEKNILNPDAIITIIEESCMLELDDYRNKDEFDRIVSFKNLRKVMEKY